MKTQKYDPICGTDILAASKTAVKMSKKNRCKVAFNFNGHKLIATPKTNADALVLAYYEASGRAHSKYWNSPQGREDRRLHAIQVAQQQREIDACFAELPTAINDTVLLLRLLQRYIANADHIDVLVSEAQHKAMIAALKQAGYTSNDALNLPVEAYNDLGVAARYIIGQVLDMMESGHKSPHPNLYCVIKDVLSDKSLKHYVVD